MGIFNFAKDLVNGITPALKKEYSPFLSAALLYMPDFKIIALDDGVTYGEIESVYGRYNIRLSFGRNHNKINELSTQIFQFLDDETIKSVQIHKPLSDFLSYQEYKKIRSVPEQRHENISKVKGKNWLVNHYLEVKSKRSYIRYLFEPENVKKIENYKKTISSGKLKYLDHSYVSRMIGGVDLSDKYILDSKFKGVDPYKRKSVARGFSLSGLEWINEQAKYEHTKKYKIMDVWYLKLSVYSSRNIVFEDVQLVNGKNKYSLHEDDFLFFSEAIERIMNRFNNFK